MSASRNNSNENDIYSFDYEEESKAFRAFLNHTLKGSSHSTDLATIPHLYGKYRKALRKKEDEIEEEETMSSFSEESTCSSSDHLQLHTDTVSEEWTGHFVLPNSKNIIKLPCYLIGYDDDGSRALVVLFHSGTNAAEQYYPVFIPIEYLPQGSADNSRKFATVLNKIDATKSIFQHTHTPVGRSTEDCPTKMCDLIIESSLIRYHYCDKLMRHSMHNGVVMKKTNENDKMDRFWYMILDRNIWFEESGVDTTVATFKVDTTSSLEQNAAFVIETTSNRSSNQSEAKLAKRIARTKKFNMCSKIASLKQTRVALHSLNGKPTHTTTGDSCLQYLLSGSSTLNKVDGSFFPCKESHDTCTCNVSYTGTDYDVKAIINKRRKEHNRSAK